LSRRRLLIGATVLAVAAGGTAAGLAAADAIRPGTPAAAAVPPPPPKDPLAADIAAEQATLRANDTDYAAWGRLGLDYVQQAKVTVNPAYYPKAEGALRRSLALNDTDNSDGMAGMAALNAAQHNFATALDWAVRGLKIDPYSSTLYGALDDAETQLGRYDDAAAATQRMLDLAPGVPSFTRAEYVYELRGDILRARDAMRSALDAATAPADRAFAHYYLGELAFSTGDPATALTENLAGLAADPTDSSCLAGKAKAEAALGRTDAAIADYTTLVSDVPQPQYVAEFGDLLTSLGRTAEARTQYDLFQTENQLFAANGVTLDTDPTLYYADHGQPALALRYGTTGIRIRPFLDMDDAYAWALHVNHRDTEALAWENKATRLGTRNALFYFHRGLIEESLGNATAARSDLLQALRINPFFSPLQAPVARAALARLGGAA
jgi:tetratricopeptide (TPR) repeat protein